jgi:hypothetical protein
MFPLTVVVTALLAAFASAQSFSSLPKCAVSSLSRFAPFWQNSPAAFYLEYNRIEKCADIYPRSKTARSMLSRTLATLTPNAFAPTRVSSRQLHAVLQKSATKPTKRVSCTAPEDEYCCAKKSFLHSATATIKYADSICVPAGVTNLPTAATCAASATGTAANASTATGSAALSASSAMSSAMSAASSAKSSASSAASSAQSAASLSVTSSAAIASSTGDASRAFYAQGLGMIGAAVGAAVALM